MFVQCLPQFGKHRGFHLGYVAGRHGYLAAWRSSLEDKWTIGHIYVDDVGAAANLARECVDFNCAKESREVELGHKLLKDDLMDLIKSMKKEEEAR